MSVTVADRGVSRRTFLRVSAAGGGLLLSVSLRPWRLDAEAVAATAAGRFAPDAFIRIDPNDQVTFIVSYVEMGHADE